MTAGCRGVVPRMPIDPLLKSYATAKNFATISTLAADGSPRTHVMWIDADDEHLLVNTEVHRAKFKDLERDPRVTIAVINAENPYQFIEARGRVVGTVRGQEARDHIDALSRRYMGTDYANTVTSERVIVQILPEKIHKNNL